MIAGRWFVTPHAVRRYIERIDPKATYEQALGALITESESAHRVGVADDGTEIWRGPRPRRLRFRVAHNHDPKRAPALVTVLAPYDGFRGKSGC